MTLAEMLIVVAIVLVLSGVAFVAVGRYQRSMGQLERDGIAKQIFVAAQNHLTEAQGEGFLGKTKYGTQVNYDGDLANGVYYYVVNSGAVSQDGEEAFGLMLPFGSIDETVRTGGSYLIRYQPKTGRVLDVFYCSTFGTP
jgi:type II secretory pathway pseudopilin PulG